MKSGGENKLVCIVDRKNLQRADQEGEHYYFVDRCVVTKDSAKVEVSSETGDHYSYEVLDANQMAAQIKREAPYYQNHLVARVKEDLLKAVAGYFERVKTQLPDKKQFVLVKRMGEANGIKLKRADNQQVQFQLYRGHNTSVLGAM